MALDAGSEVPFLVFIPVIVAAAAAGRREPTRAARLLWRRGHLQTYDGGRKAAHASEALRQIRSWMVTGSDTSPNERLTLRVLDARQDAVRRTTAVKTTSEVPQQPTCSPQQPTGEDAVENAAKKAADHSFKTIHKLYAVGHSNQATPSNSEAKLYAREQRNQDTPSNNEKQWPPAPHEARGSCPTSIWARPSSSC